MKKTTNNSKSLERTAKTDWQEILKPFYGKKCDINVEFSYAGESFEPYVFDEALRADDASNLIENVIGSWDEVKKRLGKGREELMMFAVNSQEDDPFEMVDAILFYDRETGECYKYEEGDFDPLNKSGNGAPYRLDQLKLKKV